MKKSLISFLSILILPLASWGYDDACSKPAEYTIDKRCYVTDEQKREHPYNAVVAVEPVIGGYCTGTIIKGADDHLYLYTAKHCVVYKDGSVSDTIHVKTQNGVSLTVNKNEVGDLDIVMGDNISGDWAIYDVPWDTIESTGISDKLKIGFGPVTILYDARVVGYGTLKIMSDAEIEEFKQGYIKYLRDIKGIDSNGRETRYGWRSGGVKTHGAYGKSFKDYLKDHNPSYFSDVFEDANRLKESKCKYSSNGKRTGCQGWSGNSGGPIFDDNGNLMGIMTRNAYIIGGKRHAGSKHSLFEPNVVDILLLPSKTNKVSPKKDEK